MDQDNLCRPLKHKSERSSSDRQGGGAQSSVKKLDVTNVWVTSTRTSKSFMRNGAFGSTAVYSISLRLTCRAPQCVGTGSCSPFERLSWPADMSPTSEVCRTGRCGSTSPSCESRWPSWRRDAPLMCEPEGFDCLGANWW